MVSLEDVSLITNTTFDLARRADEEYVFHLATFPKLHLSCLTQAGWAIFSTYAHV